jgi:hypothetical protein
MPRPSDIADDQACRCLPSRRRYCSLHRCEYTAPYEQCTSKRSTTAQSSFCQQHECMVSGCTDMKDYRTRGSDVCFIHLCLARDCPNQRSRTPNSGLCTIHECTVALCTSSRVTSTNVCVEHKCRWKGCLQPRDRSSDFCATHAAQYAKRKERQYG